MIFMHINSKEKSAAIKRLAAKTGERTKDIGYQDLNRTLLGLHAGKNITGKIEIPPLYQMPEVIVFAGVPEERLDLFLEEYKKAGIEPVALKAVSTMHNGSWTVFELIERLQEECGHL